MKIMKAGTNRIVISFFNIILILPVVNKKFVLFTIFSRNVIILVQRAIPKRK